MQVNSRNSNSENGSHTPMLLMPNDNWRWYFDEKHDRLMLDFADGMLFRSRFAGKALIADAFQHSRFTVEDASYYHLFSQSCGRLTLTAAQQAELALNALVALRFLKPQMPKSWYFVRQVAGYQPLAGELVCVCLQQRLQRVNLLVVESDSKATLCLLAQTELALNGRRMQTGEAIKVMNDRLTLFSDCQPQLQAG